MALGQSLDGKSSSHTSESDLEHTRESLSRATHTNECRKLKAILVFNSCDFWEAKSSAVEHHKLSSIHSGNMSRNLPSQAVETRLFQFECPDF